MASIEIFSVDEIESNLDVTTLNKWEKSLRNRAMTNDHEKLIYSICRYIELLIFYATSKDNQSQVIISRNFFKVIEDIISNSAKDIIISQMTPWIFDLITGEEKETWCIKKELLKMFNSCVTNISKISRSKIVQELSPLYLVKMFDNLNSYGDYDMQLTIMETLFRMYEKSEMDLRVKELIPESIYLCERFVGINICNFDKDCRTFLNVFNKYDEKIFSKICVRLQINDVDCVSAMDDTFWVDFNLWSKTITWYQRTECSGHTCELITVFASNVKSVYSWSQVEENEFFIHIIPSSSCLSSDKENQKLLDVQKIKISFIVSKGTTILETKVLPFIFGKKFKSSLSTPLRSLKLKTTYKPLDIFLKKRAYSDENLSSATLINPISDISMSSSFKNQSVHSRNSEDSNESNDEQFSINTTDDENKEDHLQEKEEENNAITENVPVQILSGICSNSSVTTNAEKMRCNAVTSNQTSPSLKNEELPLTQDLNEFTDNERLDFIKDQQNTGFELNTALTENIDTAVQNDDSIREGEKENLLNVLNVTQQTKNISSQNIQEQPNLQTNPPNNDQTSSTESSSSIQSKKKSPKVSRTKNINKKVYSMKKPSKRHQIKKWIIHLNPNEIRSADDYERRESSLGAKQASNTSEDLPINKEKIIDHKNDEEAKIIDHKNDQEAKIIDRKNDEEAKIIDHKNDEEAKIIDHKNDQEAKIIDHKNDQEASFNIENINMSNEINKCLVNLSQNISKDTDTTIIDAEEPESTGEQLCDKKNIEESQVKNETSKANAEAIKEANEKVEKNSIQKKSKIKDIFEINTMEEIDENKKVANENIEANKSTYTNLSNSIKDLNHTGSTTLSGRLVRRLYNPDDLNYFNDLDKQREPENEQVAGQRQIPKNESVIPLKFDNTFTKSENVKERMEETPKMIGEFRNLKQNVSTSNRQKEKITKPRISKNRVRLSNVNKSEGIVKKRIIKYMNINKSKRSLSPEISIFKEDFGLVLGRIRQDYSDGVSLLNNLDNCTKNKSVSKKKITERDINVKNSFDLLFNDKAVASSGKSIRTTSVAKKKMYERNTNGTSKKKVEGERNVAEEKEIKQRTEVPNFENKKTIKIISDVRLNDWNSPNSSPKKMKIQDSQQVNNENISMEQNTNDESMIFEALMNKPAPSWKAAAFFNKEFTTIESTDYLGKFLILFFYPFDFGKLPNVFPPVEILSLNEHFEQFQQMNTNIVGCSVDSYYTHEELVNSLLQADETLNALKFPLISDINKEISKAYRILLKHEGHSYRAAFMIDPHGCIFGIIIMNLTIPIQISDILNYIRDYQMK